MGRSPRTSCDDKAYQQFMAKATPFVEMNQQSSHEVAVAKIESGVLHSGCLHPFDELVRLRAYLLISLFGFSSSTAAADTKNGSTVPNVSFKRKYLLKHTITNSKHHSTLSVCI